MKKIILSLFVAGLVLLAGCKGLDNIIKGKLPSTQASVDEYIRDVKHLYIDDDSVFEQIYQKIDVIYDVAEKDGYDASVIENSLKEIRTMESELDDFIHRDDVPSEVQEIHTELVNKTQGFKDHLFQALDLLESYLVNDELSDDEFNNEYSPIVDSVNQSYEDVYEQIELLAKKLEG